MEKQEFWLDIYKFEKSKIRTATNIARCYATLARLHGDREAYIEHLDEMLNLLRRALRLMIAMEADPGVNADKDSVVN